MKNRFRVVLCLSFIFFGACSSRPAVMIEHVSPEAAIPAEDFPPGAHYPKDEEISPAAERIIERIKANGEDIPKYLFLESEGRFSVRADIEGHMIVYDLGSAGNTAEEIPVAFTVEDKSTGRVTQDEFLWEPKPGESGVLLAFDDYYTEAWENNFNLFERYNAKVTFFIQGEYNPFCREAIVRGHDVGYHSLNHLDLRKQSDEKIIEESVNSARVFRDNGIPLYAFAYPFGFSEPRIHNMLFGHYKLLRGYGTTFRIYDKTAICSGYIISRAIDNTVIKGEENFDRVLTLMLRTVKFMGRDYFLPLTTHDISEEAAWGITPRRLEYLLKTASELKLNFRRYSDFAEAD